MPEPWTRQLEVAQELVHVGSWQWDISSGAVLWSAELYRLYGLEPGSMAISFALFLSWVHPDDRARVEATLAGVTARSGRFRFELKIVRPDGQVRTLDTIGEALADATGTVTGMFGTCRDVTDEARQHATLRFYAEVFEHAEIGLSAWLVGDDGNLRLVASNRATQRILQASLDDEIGTTLTELLPALAGELPAVAHEVLAGGPVRDLAPVRLGKSRHDPVISVRVFPLPGGHVGLALEDVTVRHRLERVRAGERRALEMLASNAPLGEILEVIVETMEAVMPDTVASIVVVSEDGQVLRHGAAPNLPGPLNRAIDGQSIGPDVGSCGRAVYLRAPVYTEDIATDPNWAAYLDLALPFGLRACWSSPICAQDGHVLGTFALYLREVAKPDPRTIDLIARATHVASIVLARRALDEQLRALAGRIEAIREDERTQIARDIHDQLGQAMTALKLDVGWLARRIDDPPLVAKLDEMSRSSDEVIRTVRRISADLRPGILDEVGLRAAIEWQAEEFAQRNGIACEVHSTLGDAPIDRSLATMAFRIFQEALTNVTRHASASRVTVLLAFEDEQLKLEVADDGIGIPEVGPRGTTLGILGMRERARRAGGDCIVKRRQPRGTVVILRVPVGATACVVAP